MLVNLLGTKIIVRYGRCSLGIQGSGLVSPDGVCVIRTGLSGKETNYIHGVTTGQRPSAALAITHL